MKTAERIDGWILGKIERGCHSFQKWTGRTNFWLCGKASLLVGYTILIGMMAHFAGNHAPWLRFCGVPWQGRWFDWLSTAVIVPGNIIGATWSWKRLESEGLARLRTGTANPLKIDSGARLWRLMWLALVCVGPTLFGVACLAETMLRACDPLPPCEGKIKELLRIRVRTPVPVMENSR